MVVTDLVERVLDKLRLEVLLAETSQTESQSVGHRIVAALDAALDLTRRACVVLMVVVVVVGNDRGGHRGGVLTVAQRSA